MIQFNLLPDVKKKYIEAKRQKRLIMSVSTITAVSAVVLTLMLFSFVQFVQKKSIDDLSEDISSGVSRLRSVEDLDKILTIQSQLESLPELHEEKPEASRLFLYLSQLTPSNVKIRNVSVNFAGNTIELQGTAPDLAAINRFTDTFKFATFSSVDIDADSEVADQQEEGIEAFTNVITELSRSDDSSTYRIRASYDPRLFDNTQSVVLVIPEIVTTRSTQGKPNIADQADNPLFEDSGGEE